MTSQRKRSSYFVLAGHTPAWLPVAVTEIGESWWQPGEGHSRRRSDRLACELVTAGRIRLVQDGHALTVGPGQAFILKRGVAHTYHADGVAVHKVYVGLAGDLAEVIVPRLPDRVDLVVRPALRRFAALRRLLRAQAEGWQARASGLAYDLLVDCMAANAAARGAVVHEAVRRVLPVLERGEARTRSINAIAGEAGVSTAQLYRLFRRAIGTTPQRYARACQLRQARHALAETGDAVQDIARRLGHSDPFYFATWFKRETGMTPSGYRERQGGG